MFSLIFVFVIIKLVLLSFARCFSLLICVSLFSFQVPTLTSVQCPRRDVAAFICGLSLVRLISLVVFMYVIVRKCMRVCVCVCVCVCVVCVVEDRLLEFVLITTSALTLLCHFLLWIKKAS